MTASSKAEELSNFLSLSGTQRRRWDAGNFPVLFGPHLRGREENFRPSWELPSQVGELTPAKDTKWEVWFTEK